MLSQNIMQPIAKWRMVVLHPLQGTLISEVHMLIDQCWQGKSQSIIVAGVVYVCLEDATQKPESGQIIRRNRTKSQCVHQ